MGGKAPNEPVYEEYTLDWKGLEITIRWCRSWLGNETAHIEIMTPDRSPHPISQTGYRSHFCPEEIVIDAGGPVVFVTAWLESKNNGRPVQLPLI